MHLSVGQSHRLSNMLLLLALALAATSPAPAASQSGESASGGIGLSEPIAQRCRLHLAEHRPLRGRRMQHLPRPPRWPSESPVLRPAGWVNIAVQVWDGLSNVGNSSVFSVLNNYYDGTPQYFTLP